MKRYLMGGVLIALAACATTTTSGDARIAPLKASSASVEETLKALTALCGAEARVASKASGAFKRYPGMGTGGFKVDTANPEAQAWFDYGLQLSHAFYHEDAKAAMKKAVAADPACALCAWGEAWVLGPTLNYGIDEAGRIAALAAAERARSLVKPGDVKAQRLADAIVARYAAPDAAVKGGLNALGGPKAGKSTTEPAFGDAMQKIALDYPAELELSVLAAHALLIPVRGDDMRGLKPALALLDSVLKQKPNDTGAIHYYIHATEFDDRAEDAIAYANRLGVLAPAASHLVHMPAHTFFHAGRYEDAALVNAEAINADRTWETQGGSPVAPKAPAGSVPMYYAHNLSFGVTSALMAGDRELAMKYAVHAQGVWPVSSDAETERRRGYPISRTYVAFGRYAPDQALALPEPGKTETLLAAYRHYARGEALLTKGDIQGAGVEAHAISTVKDAAKEPQAKIARLVLQGRIAMLTGDPQKAAGIFLKAATFQEKELKDSWDPPGWWYPVRRSAAAAYLKAGDPKRAAIEAEQSLKVWKHDPLALWVLGKAQIASSAQAQGETTLGEARKIWRGDFDSITLDAI